MGGATSNILANAISMFALYVLNLKLGISATVVGVLLAVPRILDAITDPVMGNLSDRFSSRWGRRRPFIFWGALAAAVSYVLLWQIPTSWAPDGYFWPFLILSLVYYLATTVFSVPWLALGYDLTGDVGERTRVMAAVQIAASVTGLCTVWLLPVTQWSIFSDTIQGVRWVSVAVALFVAASGALVFIYCRESHGSAPQSRREGKEQLSLKTSLGAAFRNRPFLILCGVVVAMLLGIMSVNSLTPYIIIYFLHGGDMSAASVLIAANGTVWTVSGLVMVPVVAWAAGRFGKKQTLVVCLALALFGNLLKWNLYSPDHPWTVVIPQFFVALAFASLWTLLNSMIADTCDYTELQTGERIEGMLAGIYGWLIKLGVSLAFFLSGLLIDLAGFKEAAGGLQPGGVITSMRLIELGLPAIAYVAALALLTFYPLTEARMVGVQEAIRRKRTTSYE